MQQLDREDAKDIGNDEAQKAAREWRYYSDPGNERALQHRSLQGKIRPKLDEYRAYTAKFGPFEVETDRKCPDKALLLQSQVLALSPPSTRALKGFRRWLSFKDVPVLWGPDEKLFTDERDLVALAPTETDRLDAFLQNYLGWFFRVGII